MNDQNHNRRSRAPSPECDSESLPPHHQYLVNRCVFVQYKLKVKCRRSCEDVVKHLGLILPGVERWIEVWRVSSPYERPHRFLVFGSEDPQALSICPDDESVAAALVSASIYHSDQTWTCAPPQSHEKAFAASKITGEDLPYVGAEWVFGLGRQKSNGIVTTPAHPSSLSTSGPTSTSLTTPLDENEGTLPGSIPSITDKSDPENQSGNSKRTRDQIDSAEVASPDNDPEEVAGPVKKARVDDHITTEDRKLFVQHMVKAHQDSDVNSPRAIKDFIRVASRRVVLARLIVYADSRRTYPQFGSNRAWTSSQWAEYLKQNKKQIQSEVATLTRTKAESTQV